MFFFLFLFELLSYGQVGIGTTVPDESSILDVSSTNKGFLHPRLTEAERDGIANPAKGLTVYNLDEDCLQINSGTSSSPDWSCVGSSSVVSSTSSVLNDCNANGFEGVYVNGLALTASSIFSVTITNNSFNSTDNISFTTGDLVLSGVSGLSVSGVSPTSATIVSGGSQVIEYSLTGTPSGIGTLTGDWTKLGLNCARTVNVTNGDAVFTLPQTAIVVSINDGTPLVDVQGVIDNTSHQLTVTIPYTGGIGSYDAYTSAWVANNAGTAEGTDANSFRLSYPAGTFSASGNIIATIEVDGDGSFNAEKQLFGAEETIASLDFQVNGNSKGSLNLDVIGGIPDREFGDGVHDFIYLPVTAADGNVWLNNNLGANYANMNHASFNPVQQATARNDYHAYGSLYQWGRYSDGHELINYTNATSGNLVNSSTTTHATTNTPGHSNYIRTNTYPYDWRSPQNNNLWQGEAGINNPCPQGYRLPTKTEYDALLAAEGITNYTTAASSTLAFSVSGYVSRDNGVVVSETVISYCWSSNLDNFRAGMVSFGISSSSTSSIHRSSGVSVRCIQD